MKDYKIKETIFKNKMKLISLPVKSELVSIGIFVNIGSRYETKDNHGIAHFLEHMMFKGTKNLTYDKIAEKLDSVGASYNAGTSYEYTYYYIYGHIEHLELFIKIILDIFFNPTFTNETISSERNVVLEEYRMSRDDNVDILYNIVHNHIFSNSNLSRNILGTEESIRSLNKQKLKSFREKYYTPNNSIISLIGDYKNDHIKLIEKIVNRYPYKKTTLDLKINKQIKHKQNGIFYKHKNDLNQTNLMIVFKSFDKFNSNNEKITLLEHILSSGSSSRLFNLLRNRHGITYFSYASNMAFLKEGLFMIHIGVDNKKLLLAINSILEELHNLKQNGITDNELIKAKNIQNTNYALSLQTPNNISQYYGLIELFHNSQDYTYSKVKKRYNQITKEDINNIIKTIFKKENMNIFIYGCNNKPDKKDLFNF
tara:strand:+ start:526 stop:1803 length:1278 start_codon:yes stop_codon:yes gene_type:complete